MMRRMIKLWRVTCLVYAGVFPLWAASEKNHEKTQEKIHVQEFSTQGGTSVRLIEEHSLPVISFSFLMRAGDVYDPLDKPYLSSAIMDLLTEGTVSLKSDELKEQLLAHGIQLSFSPLQSFLQVGRRESLMIQMRTTKAHLKEAMDLLKDMVLHSSFEKNSLKEWQDRIEASLLNVQKNPDYIAENALRSLMFNGHILGTSYLKPELIADIKNISSLDVRTGWSRFLTQDRLKIGICGDITRKHAQEVLEDILKNVPQTSVLDPIQAPQFPQESHIKIIETPHPQVAVRVAHPGLSRQSPHYGAYALMVHLLGGGMSSRLFNEIREKRGLVYSINAMAQERLSGPLLFFSFETKGDQAHDAFQALTAQLHLIKEKGITARELALAKSSLLGSLARGYSSTMAIANRLAVSLHLGEPTAFQETLEKQIDATSLEDLNAFIKTFIEPLRLQVVMVGHIPSQRPISEEKNADKMNLEGASS